MLIKIKKWYIFLVEKDNKKGGELVLFFLLLLFSFIYGFIAAARNLLYDKGILKSFTPSKKVISIGNISWAGTGKTTLAIWLYKKLSGKFKTAVLRRGWGGDEGCLLNQITNSVYAGVNRVSLVKNLSSKFEIFILDDGFQHRKLSRNIDIVLLLARDIKSNFYLLPAGIFREPFTSLRRAQIVLINYANELDNPQKFKEFLIGKFNHLKIFFARYKFKRIADLTNQEYSLADLREKKLAAVTAIGYPQGFFNTLKDLNLNPAAQITYPDHHNLNNAEFTGLKQSLGKKQIKDIIITAKDKYHFPKNTCGLSIYILEVEMEIDREDAFWEEIMKVVR